MEFYLHNWKYTLTKDGDTHKLSVENGQPLPESLYKYYSITKHSISALENCEFYVSQPDDFNDLFDSSDRLLDLSKIDFNDVLTIFQGADIAEIEEWWKKCINDNQIGTLVEQCRNKLYETMISKFGIVCLTPKRDHELMWAYYNNNQGFCVEYDYSIFPANFRGPYPIKYLENLSLIDFKRYGGHASFYLMTLCKKSIWKHEDEYRFLVMPSKEPFKVKGRFDNSGYNLPFKERLEKYPVAAIKSITFGFNFVKDSNPKLVSPTRFTLRFNMEEETGRLKASLFRFLVNKGIQVYGILQEVPLFKFGHEHWKLTMLEENLFAVDFEPVNDY